MPLSAVAAKKLAQEKRAAAQNVQIQEVETEGQSEAGLALTTLKEAGSGNTGAETRSVSRKRKRRETKPPKRLESDESDHIEIISASAQSPEPTGQRGLRSAATPQNGTTTALPDEDRMLGIEQGGPVRPAAVESMAAPEAALVEDSSDESMYGVPTTKAPPRYETFALSSVRPEYVSYRRIHGIQAAAIHLVPDETIVAIGQYDLWVKKGYIGLNGTIIGPGPKTHRVHAASPHALPVLMAAESPFGGDKRTEVVLFSCNTGMRLLETVNPGFEKLWNDAVDANDRASFRLLWNSSEDTLERPLCPLSELEAMNFRAMFMGLSQDRRRIVLVCGPKGTGKSSFTRWLTNSLLFYKNERVAYLDIDPGQPEYRPPGDVSLCIVKEYNFGPSYCHPNCTEGQNTVSRAHHFGFLTPRDDPEHYHASVMDLFQTYQRLHSEHPLIINCSGWIQGSGLESLEALITSIKPTNTVYTSNWGPEEVTEVLNRSTAAAGSCLYMMPSSAWNPGQRTSADLRTMLTMSYFHSRMINGAGPEFHWDPTPVDEMQHLEWPCDGPNQVIDAITTYTDFIEPKYLKYSLEMSVAALVAVYNNEHLSLALALDSEHQQVATSQAENTWHEFAAPSQIREHQTQLDNATRELETVALHRTPEGLPYYFPGTGGYTPFDPASSETLGQVLIRKIDGERKCMRVVTPVPMEVLEEHRGRGAAIVLVKGKLDRPDWAHLEPWFVGTWRKQEYEKWRTRFKEGGGEDDVDDGMDHMKFDGNAWARKTNWVGLVRDDDWEWRRKNRVWKVRRNLETSDGRK